MTRTYKRYFVNLTFFLYSPPSTGLKLSSGEEIDNDDIITTIHPLITVRFRHVGKNTGQKMVELEKIRDSILHLHKIDLKQCNDLQKNSTVQWIYSGDDEKNTQQCKCEFRGSHLPGIRFNLIFRIHIFKIDSISR